MFLGILAVNAASDSQASTPDKGSADQHCPSRVQILGNFLILIVGCLNNRLLAIH